jgi:hypothetical protein
VRAPGMAISLIGWGSLVNWETGGVAVISASIEANVSRADNRRHPADLASSASSFAICLTYASVNCVFASTFVSFDGKLAFWLIVIFPVMSLIRDAFITALPAVRPDGKDLRVIFVFRPSPSSPAQRGLDDAH